MTLTQPLRDEHAELWPRVLEISAVAAAVGQWNADVSARLRATVSFLHDHLLAHAAAEEAALYPRVEKAFGVAGVTETMVVDHRVIAAHVEALAELAGKAGGAPAPEVVERLKAELYGIAALLEVHFRKEEDVYLPRLDAWLTAGEAEAMFAEMRHVAHG